MSRVTVVEDAFGETSDDFSTPATIVISPPGSQKNLLADPSLSPSSPVRNRASLHDTIKEDISPLPPSFTAKRTTGIQPLELKEKPRQRSVTQIELPSTRSTGASRQFTPSFNAGFSPSPSFFGEDDQSPRSSLHSALNSVRTIASPKSTIQDKLRRWQHRRITEKLEHTDGPPMDKRQQKIFESQMERMLTELPGVVEFQLLAEAHSVVEKIYQKYVSQVGKKHPVTILAKQRLQEQQDKLVGLGFMPAKEKRHFAALVNKFGSSQPDNQYM